VDTTQQTDINSVLALVQRFARRFIHDYHDAEDLAQDVMIKVLRAYKRNPSISDANDAQIAAWLLMITRNTAIDMVRAAKKRERFSHELTDCHYASSDVESDIEAREIIDAALSRLPEREQVLLVLDAQGYTYKEIAQREKMTRGGVGSGLHRARIAVRAQGELVAA
jgi:RNA polymerase sigma-70 factor, ECF subfamily